ncbi:prepilin-type cleavage/methylation domain-containing protein [Photobacterium gaetbulicola]|uniref:Type II secretion system protein H n=1 Tax=Photobacterium gaetbulicola Gung47 TaxID=658445 RepID=A0A0C5WXQ1_9GAMM|nr:GspH/FimT family pseudopilin [Photobacterium gaetbulicola]AJR09764.1 putative type IV pilin [Photobacterium gaetbulicola Gung47]PSU12282.1 prepilin-type cleavage/methylation domain-containing protein [Photobacterium gaetbulicola]
MYGVHKSYLHVRQDAGFSLLELLIALTVVVTLVSAAAPSFNNVLESNKIRRLAIDIERLLAQAKSEAVMRGEDITVETVDVGFSSAVNTAPDWLIRAKTSSGNEVIAQVSGDQFPSLSFYMTFTKDTIGFDSMTGRPELSGSFVFSVGGRESVRVKTNLMTGRLYVCSENGGYGYGICS